jgi:hypothetical protein
LWKLIQFSFQWKKKLAKIKATARFRAAYLTISLVSKFSKTHSNGEGEAKTEEKKEEESENPPAAE